MSLAHRLYAGEVSYDFVAKRRRWYALSAAVLVISIAALLFRGLNLGIDFKGGTTYEFDRATHTSEDARGVMRSVGEPDATVQQIGQGRLRVTTPVQSTARVAETQAAIAKSFGIDADKQITVSTVGPTWGNEISRKALTGLLIFLVVVVIFLAARFEPKMALAAIIALLHDILITVGIYALVGFEVTPSTVIAFLTILGFSLYDTVVVFDRVRETTQGLQSGSRRTYSAAANLALNQTLMRSINTSFIALVPVAALLFVGAGLLGAGTLKDLALAQFVGLAAGAYSSIFIATPLLAQFKEREEGMKVLAARVARATAAGKITVPGRRPVTAGGPSLEALDAAETARPETTRAAATRAPQPRPRRKGNTGRPGSKRRR